MGDAFGWEPAPPKRDRLAAFCVFVVAAATLGVVVYLVLLASS